ncbi:MAG: O-antigen ligase family protein [Chloroflexi bacterium]|nr:O-antigen ligase family protein [Chloroflexota bacterium]
MFIARQNYRMVGLALALIMVAGALIVLPTASALALIGGALALVAMARWHELALYALIFAVPYGSWFPIQISVANVTAVDVLVALLVALWFARMIARDRRIAIRLPALSLPFALFLFAALLSTTAAVSFEFAAKELIKWLEMFAMYLYVANNLDEKQLPRVLVALLLAGMTEAAIGIYQFVFRWGPEGFLLFGQFIRAFGTFEQPNPFAGYLALIAPITIGLVFAVDSEQSTVNSKTVHCSLFTVYSLAFVAVPSGIAMLAAVLMSWSRGAWIGVAAGCVVAVVAQSRRAFVLTNVAALALIVIAFLGSLNLIPPMIADRFSGITDYFGVFDVRGVRVDDANFALVERMAHWQAAAEMFARNPVLGVGFGNYAPAYPAYSLPRWDDPLGHAHNYYLNVAAETGAIGLLAYLALWGAAFWQAWRAIRVARGWQRGVAAGLLGMLVALSVHNLFDNLFVHGIAVQVGIGLGILEEITNSGERIANGK